jgi:hypothetical protein
VNVRSSLTSGRKREPSGLALDAMVWPKVAGPPSLRTIGRGERACKRTKRRRPYGSEDPSLGVVPILETESTDPGGWALAVGATMRGARADVARQLMRRSGGKGKRDRLAGEAGGGEEAVQAVALAGHPGEAGHERDDVVG